MLNLYKYKNNNTPVIPQLLPHLNFRDAFKEESLDFSAPKDYHILSLYSDTNNLHKVFSTIDHLINYLQTTPEIIVRQYQLTDFDIMQRVYKVLEGDAPEFCGFNFLLVPNYINTTKEVIGYAMAYNKGML